MKVKELLVAGIAGWLLQSTVLAQNWTTDFAKAQVTAKEQDRAVFLFFTGSDWCGWCKKLDREILSTPEFTSFAAENLVLVKIDFPRYAPLPPEQALANQQLSARFSVAGYPSVYIVGKDGKVAGQLGYMEGGPASFIKQITSFTGPNWRAGASSPAAPAKPNIAAATPPAPPPFNGAQLMPPKRFNDLQITGIIGTKKRPLILINNRAFEVGETAHVRVRDREILVTCKEIRAKSALVLTEGSQAPTEIFLASDKGS